MILICYSKKKILSTVNKIFLRDLVLLTGDSKKEKSILMNEDLSLTSNIFHYQLPK